MRVKNAERCGRHKQRMKQLFGQIKSRQKGRGPKNMQCFEEHVTWKVGKRGRGTDGRKDEVQQNQTLKRQIKAATHIWNGDNHQHGRGNLQGATEH